MIPTTKVWWTKTMILQIMKTTQSPRKKKQSITTVGLELLADQTKHKKIKPTSDTAACMASPKKTSLPNTKKTAMASTRVQHE